MELVQENDVAEAKKYTSGRDGELTYVLYDWQGKCKWSYLFGMFLVDPKHEQEFLSLHQRSL